MRRSFGGGGGPMGGGGAMIITVQKAVRAGVGGAPPEPISPSANTTTTISRKDKHFNKNTITASTLSSSSSTVNNGNSNNNGPSPFSSLINHPLSAASGAAEPSWGASSSSSCSDDSEWWWVDGVEDDQRGRVSYDDFVFGTVPSRDEVHHAVSALQQVVGASPYRHFSKEKFADDVAGEVSNPIAESGMDWVEPSLDLYNSRILQPHRRSDRVYDAFHLLQTEPSVQRMVISLSSDKAVWDAVLNNEVVKELRGSIRRDDNLLGESSGEGSNDSNQMKHVLSWIISNAKAKIMQLIDGITKLINEVLGKTEKGGNTEGFPLDEKLKTSLLLSVVVLLIVVITRAQSAPS